MEKAAFAIAILLSASVFAQDFYKLKHNVNVDEVLNSERLRNNYFDCFMDKGPCTGASLELKKFIPDALQTSCKRCSPDQREGIVKTVKYLSEEQPHLWKELSEKFDPEGKFKAAAESDPKLKKYNLKL